MSDTSALILNAAPHSTQSYGVEFSDTPRPSSSSSQPQPPQNDDASVVSILKSSSHPTVMVFHLLFKSMALIFYLLSTFFTSNFIFIFVITILLLACDFWTVKNVSGRLLVGLRWWNEVTDQGSQWIFESRDKSHACNRTDERVFWFSLYVTLLIWSFFALVAVIKLQLHYLLIVFVALSLTGANLGGFIKCDKDKRQKWESVSSVGSSNGPSRLFQVFTTALPFLSR